MKDFNTTNEYQQIFLRSSRKNNAAKIPNNTGLIDWALCVVSTQTLFKGSGAEQLKELLSTSFIADIPSEAWDNTSFNHLTYCAIDIFLICDGYPTEFWKNFSSCNCIKVYQDIERNQLNQQLYWRGSLRVQDPQNPSHFGELDNSELWYGYDELDVLLSQIRNEISPLVPKQVWFDFRTSNYYIILSNFLFVEEDILSLPGNCGSL